MVPSNLHLAEVRFTFSFLRVHVEFLLLDLHNNLEGGPPILLHVTNFNTFLFLVIIMISATKEVRLLNKLLRNLSTAKL
jgi:hypothetical protein